LGRFIRYVNYPYWCAADDLCGRFEININPPDQIAEDVILFTQGKVTFNVIPKKQGRRERIVRNVIFEEGSNVAQSGGSGDTGGDPSGIDSGVGGPDKGDGIPGEASGRRKRASRKSDKKIAGADADPPVIEPANSFQKFLVENAENLKNVKIVTRVVPVIAETQEEPLKEGRNTSIATEKTEAPKKKGRPPGSKNKVKGSSTTGLTTRSERDVT
jgi:hypothetical protein